MSVKTEPQLPRPLSEDQPGPSHARAQIARILRVDQAGEFGAKRIYQGQLDVFAKRPGMARTEALIRHMAEQEDEHLDRFNDLVAERGVRPTVLQPFWHVAGYTLGAATALMGEKAAMACTAAVESVIDEHYARQQSSLDRLKEAGTDESGIKASIDKFRADEAEHHDTALEEGAAQTPGYRLLSGVIKACSKSAIWLSERF